MAQQRPLVFVGSSTEGLSYAHAIQSELDHDCECVVWSQGVFGLSQGGLEALVEKLPTFDFATLVLTPDDLVESRGERHAMPRDNVLLELGMCLGALGRQRTFLVVDRDAALKLPSDLAGVTTATFRPPAKGNYQSAVGAACSAIRDAVRSVGPRKRDLPVRIWATQHLSTKSGENSICFYVENLGDKDLPPFRIVIAHPRATYHLFEPEKSGRLLPGQKRAFHCAVQRHGKPVPYLPPFDRDLQGTPLDEAADNLFAFQLVLEDSDRVLFEDRRLGLGVVKMLRAAVASPNGEFGAFNDWQELRSHDR